MSAPETISRAKVHAITNASMKIRRRIGKSVTVVMESLHLSYHVIAMRSLRKGLISEADTCVKISSFGLPSASGITEGLVRSSLAAALMGL